jgi:hypothetical protein
MMRNGSVRGGWSAVAHAAPWILGAFAVIWATFVLLGEWGRPAAMLAELIAVPAVFALLALLSRIRARLAGVASITAAIGAFFFFSLHEIFRGNAGALVVFALVPLPLLAVGVSLILSREGRNK